VLRSAGQSQQAVEVLNRAIAANPKTPGAFATQARLYADMNQHEQALTALQQAVTNGDSAASVANYALAIGQQKYRAATPRSSAATSRRRSGTSSSRTRPTARRRGSSSSAASFSTANMWLQEAQRLSKPAPASAVPRARVQNAQGAFVTAQANLPAGASSTAGDAAAAAERAAVLALRRPVREGALQVSLRCLARDP
jgi:tetratricopeptide (TPR) repeat protein